MLNVKSACATSQPDAEPVAMDWREVLDKVHTGQRTGTLIDNFQCAFAFCLLLSSAALLYHLRARHDCTLTHGHCQPQLGMWEQVHTVALQCQGL